MNEKPVKCVVREVGGTFETFEQVLLWVEMNKKYQPWEVLLLNNPFVINLERNWKDHWIDEELEIRWNLDNEFHDKDKYNHETFS